MTHKSIPDILQGISEFLIFSFSVVLRQPKLELQVIDEIWISEQGGRTIWLIWFYWIHE